MFLLNNIHDRDYARIYPSTPGVLFDISDAQLRNAKNAAWNAIKPGDVVCVVRSSRNMSTFSRVESKLQTDAPDGEGGFQHVIVGKVIAKLPMEQKMTYLLNRFEVSNPYLPANKFSIGFNVADLEDALADLQVQTRDGICALGTL